MNHPRILLFLVLLMVASLFGVKVGTDGENIYINGNKTGVGVDTLTDPQAIFEVFADDDGILIPRLTVSQRDGISAPEDGLLIYNTDCSLFNYWDGTNWIPFPDNYEFSIGTISGSAAVCSGTMEVAYSIPSVTGATSYSWTVPSGSSISSGAGTNSIMVDFGSSSGDVCVTVNTLCGSESECFAVSVTAASVGGSVSGGSTITLGESTGSLILSGITGSVVNWQRQLDSGTWSNISFTGMIYSETPSATGTWHYRAVVQNGSCPVAYSSYATVIVEEEVSIDSLIFTYTGSTQSFTVPSGVTSIVLRCWGAEGGNGQGRSYCTGGDRREGYGGQGAYVEGSLSVTPGQTIYVEVGGQNGYNGGGSGGIGSTGTCGGSGCRDGGDAGPGGGASDVRVGGTALANRVIVAAGGGGGGGQGCEKGGDGGDAVGGIGEEGRYTSDVNNGWGGDGGDATAGDGGDGGTAGNAGYMGPRAEDGGNGSLGNGGDGGDGGAGAGGGGGGYYGGGGGGGGGYGYWPGGSGGGGAGSSYYGGVTSVSTADAANSGDGKVIVRF